MFSFLRFAVLLVSLKVICGLEFEEFLKWKQIAYEVIEDATLPSQGVPDFLFPDKIDLSGQNSFIPANNIPQGVNHFKGRLFITVPRRSPGIPSTLNYIDLNQVKAGDSPKLKSYPNAAINSLYSELPAGENRFVSVYRTRWDDCNRLWFVDTGMLEYPNNRTQVQPPSIWVLDLQTNKMIRRYEVPSSIVTEGRGMVTITPDVNYNRCNEAFAYLPDLVQNALYVYSFKENRMWTFRHNYFYFDPLSGDYNIAGQRFNWRDGIFSITLGAGTPDGYRNAYFHPLSSNAEFMVSTRVLRNETNSRRAHHGSDFQYLGSRGQNKESAVHVYDPYSGTIFYTQIALNGIGCWNTRTSLSNETHDIVHQDPQSMIYPSDITVDPEGTIWAMSNTLPRFIYSRLDYNQFNFRVWRQRGVNAIEGTRCA